MQNTLEEIINKLDPISLQNSAKLNQLIIDISLAEELTFARYMRECLYHYLYGYYTSGKVRISKEIGAKVNTNEGFITAPHISPIFGQVLAKQIAEYIQISGKTTVIELGAGTGKLASDIMLYLAKTDSLPQKYYLLEINQKNDFTEHIWCNSSLSVNVAKLIEFVSWEFIVTQQFDNVFVIANEFFDALPVEVISYNNNHWQLMSLNWQEGWQFVKAKKPLVSVEPELDTWLASINKSDSDASDSLKQTNSNFVDGYQSEFNISLRPWVEKLGLLAKNCLAIVIDYGFGSKDYYSPERNKGTLRGYLGNRLVEDVLLYQGLQDITASVDFSWLAYCADKNDFEILGYHSQADFLISGGLLELAPTQVTSDKEQLIISQQIQYLVDLMGNAFKVMVLYKGVDSSAVAGGLSGLMGKDLRPRL